MCMQMLDHDNWMVSLIIYGGEEEMTSWVWSIHTNFVRLTHTIPMAQVEDLPEAMQC